MFALHLIVIKYAETKIEVEKVKPKEVQSAVCISGGITTRVGRQ